jgi:hypothetical protein
MKAWFQAARVWLRAAWWLLANLPLAVDLIRRSRKDSASSRAYVGLVEKKVAKMVDDAYDRMYRIEKNYLGKVSHGLDD